MRALLKNKKRLFLIIVGLMVLYVLIAIMTSRKLEKMIDTSYETLGLENPYKYAISDEKFERLCVRRSYLPRMEGDPRYREEYSRTPVKTVHCFVVTVSSYEYTYELLEDDRCIHGSWGIPVTVVSVLGRVVYIYEAP